MDDKDSKIIDILRKDSRVSFRKIAKETGLSTDTVMRRYQKLEKEGVIQPTIKVDLVKLGYEAMTNFTVKVTAQSDLSAVIKEAAKIPDVLAIIGVAGKYDLLLMTCVRSINHVFEIGDEIAKIPGIRRIAIDQFILPFKGDATFPPPVWHNLNTRQP